MLNVIIIPPDVVSERQEQKEKILSTPLPPRLQTSIIKTRTSLASRRLEIRTWEKINLKHKKKTRFLMIIIISRHLFLDVIFKIFLIIFIMFSSNFKFQFFLSSLFPKLPLCLIVLKRNSENCFEASSQGLQNSLIIERQN